MHPHFELQAVWGELAAAGGCNMGRALLITVMGLCFCASSCVCRSLPARALAEFSSIITVWTGRRVLGHWIFRRELWPPFWARIHPPQHELTCRRSHCVTTKCFSSSAVSRGSRASTAQLCAAGGAKVGVMLLLPTGKAGSHQLFAQDQIHWNIFLVALKNSLLCHFLPLCPADPWVCGSSAESREV